MSTRWQPEAGWYPDPGGVHEWRWWDGSRWADTINDGGVAADDPLDDAVASALPPGPPSPASPLAAEVHQRASGPEILRFILYAILFNVLPIVVAVAVNEPVGWVFTFGALAFIAPYVGYRVRDWLLFLIPLYGFYLMFKFAWRLACLPRHYWSNYPD